MDLHTIVSRDPEDDCRLLAGNFCGQSIPGSLEQMSFRTRQQMVVSGMIGGIANADTMIRICPGAAAEILEAARSACLRPLPQTDQDLAESPGREIALTAKISAICIEHR
jgi:hypothetical protein